MADVARFHNGHANGSKHLFGCCCRLCAAADEFLQACLVDNKIYTSKVVLSINAFFPFDQDCDLRTVLMYPKKLDKRPRYTGKVPVILQTLIKRLATLHEPRVDIYVCASFVVDNERIHTIALHRTFHVCIIDVHRKSNGCVDVTVTYTWKFRAVEIVQKQQQSFLKEGELSKIDTEKSRVIRYEKLENLLAELCQEEVFHPLHGDTTYYSKATNLTIGIHKADTSVPRSVLHVGDSDLLFTIALQDNKSTIPFDGNNNEHVAKLKRLELTVANVIGSFSDVPTSCIPRLYIGSTEDEETGDGIVIRLQFYKKANRRSRYQPMVQPEGMMKDTS